MREPLDVVFHDSKADVVAAVAVCETSRDTPIFIGVPGLASSAAFSVLFWSVEAGAANATLAMACSAAAPCTAAADLVAATALLAAVS